MTNEHDARPSILVVDDTIENLRLLAGVLRDHGYEPRPVMNGRLALQAAERAIPDLILLDITMPDMDGFEVCMQLKRSELLREVPVIFLTALTGTEEKLKAFGIGGVDYIEKPFQVPEVLARVRAHVALRRAQIELTRNYEQLRELERLRDDLVHMIVHDMRSPLLGVMLHVGLLQKSIAEVPAAQKTLARVEAAIHSVSRMANDLLDVSRIEEGKLPLQLETCDVAALTSEVAATFADPNRGVVVEECAPAHAHCDAAIVRRVLENLTSNAIKHTPAGTAIRLNVVQGPTSVRVEVKDNGRGVPPEQRQRIFEKFAAARRGEGEHHSAGLGLAFCKLAVEAQSGAIGVDANEGGGSVFWFELPRAH
jgi:signal transduction histidine kinase